MTTLLAAALTAWLTAAGPAAPPRFAVVVGANGAAPGRRPLRYAHRDAQEMAAVLLRTGEFPAEQLKVLLDPEPGDLLAALDGALARAARAPQGALLVFYYSGHASTDALFPNGKPLALTLVRQRLESPSATVRVGILDACRGGGWTQAKGLEPDAPFEIHPPLTLTSEGSALLASSSGLESAHESEALAESFFTHHLVAGLAGAADRDGDGQVSLGEAFDYARGLTVRDTSLQADAPQHPSFQMNLRGRGDLPLARVAASETLVELRQDQGPLQVVQLSTGLVVLELPSGKRAVRVAVAPGRYLVRSKGASGVRARELVVEEGRSAVVPEESLELVVIPRLTRKEVERRPVLATTLPGGAVQVTVMVGANGRNGSVPAYPVPGGLRDVPDEWMVPLGVAVGITDRVELALPLTLAYRFGDPAGIELVPWAGVTDLAYQPGAVWATPPGGTTPAWADLWSYGVGAGAGLRRSSGHQGALNAALELYSVGTWGGATHAPTSWRALAGGGYSWTLWRRISVNVGLSFLTPPVNLGSAVPALASATPGNSTSDAPALVLGAVRWSGARSLPALQWHVAGDLSFDFDAAVWWNLANGQSTGRWATGMTMVF